MKDRYKQELERLGPGQEELERLYTLIEGGTDMKWKKWLGRRAVAAIAVCAALTLTATAAAVPAVWQSLQEHLGPFAPYAQTIKGSSCSDQGIKIQILSALSDDLAARFYLSVQDVEGDRLNEFLELTGRLTAGEEKLTEAQASGGGIIGGGSPSTRNFKLVSYDPDTRTALLSATVYYEEAARPTEKARLEVTGMTTRLAEVWLDIPCASVTGRTLNSLPVGENDKVIYQASDSGFPEYTNAVLPARKVVLAPGQTPMDIEGTEDIRVSSMGFAGDGRFHVRLDFAEGVRPGLHQDGKSDLMFGLYGVDDNSNNRFFVYQQTLVDGGMDILFPLIKAEDLQTLQSGQVKLTGRYWRPGADIEGSWSVDFDLEYYASTVLDWTDAVNGWRMKEVTLSPLSVTMTGYKADSSGALAYTPLYAVKKDGTEIAAEPGMGRYSNLEVNGGEGWECYATWYFVEPVEVEDIACLSVKGTRIPVN